MKTSTTKTTKTTKTTTKKTATKTKSEPKRARRPPVDVVAGLATLKATYPDAHCELDHKTAFELLVATVLSAQSTDVGVNKATPGLFARWPDAASLAAASIADVEQAIGTLGMFRQKAKRIVELSKLLVSEHAGEVPAKLDALVKLPGVGRKTANVVLGVWFKAPEGVVVDTHVQRLTQRLGWTKHDAPEDIEQDLMKKVPRADWDAVSHLLIFHGRRTCSAQRPACERCSLKDVCPVEGRAENVGRKKW
jgi:endonuclease-3